MSRPPAVTDVFSAIGHPRRRDLVSALADGDKRVSELVATLGVAQSTVSEHLGILRSAGLVDSTKQGREQIYSFDPAPLRDVIDWFTRLEVFWGERHQRLAILLDTIDQKEDQ
ncbi:ArsR/SmtB family transcription factor [Kytococcus sedentarius]|uniref:ArsR/SmtB family transcription factor n=1 Tax=Kytococcus sedentarius TaxID=1276 RepID=UPI00384DD92C